jgi:hypothetical protein
MIRHTEASGRLSVLLTTLLVAVAITTSCSDPTLSMQPKTPETPVDGGSAGMKSVGTYIFSATGIGTDQMSVSARQVLDADGKEIDLHGAQASLGGEVTGLVFEQNQVSTFVDGSRSQGGERYITLTYRVRNGSGAPVSNVTLIPATRSTPTPTIAGTPWLSLTLFNGSPASAAIAQSIVPTGAVALDDHFALKSLYPDVLQVFSEAEIAAATLPPTITSIFPYGFMIRNRNTNANRTLPATADANQFDGLLTFTFRFPLTNSSGNDPFSFQFMATAFSDSETRLTESMEESGDTAGVRRLRDRATELGATTITVLNGSTVMDPAVPDYPGQRQICSPRTAGSAGSPTTFMNAEGPYAHVLILYPGESVNSCSAYFRSGTASRPATNVPYSLAFKAMDRYGNVKAAIADSVHIVDVGPPATYGGTVPMVSGSAAMNITYSNYGTSTLTSIGKRLEDERSVVIAGVVRTWTAGAGTTDWNNNNNWSPAAVPMSQDSVYIPVSAPFQPAITSNVSVRGLTVENGATVSLGAFDLTSSANVTAGSSGGITNTSGRLFLAGIAATAEGKVPVLRVTGTYSLTNNITGRAPIQVDAGRLTVSGFRLQADSN